MPPYWQGKPEVRGQKTVPVPHFTPTQTPHKPAWVWTWPSAKNVQWTYNLQYSAASAPLLLLSPPSSLLYYFPPITRIYCPKRMNIVNISVLSQGHTSWHSIHKHNTDLALFSKQAVGQWIWHLNFTCLHCIKSAFLFLINSIHVIWNSVVPPSNMHLSSYICINIIAKYLWLLLLGGGEGEIYRMSFFLHLKNLKYKFSVSDYWISLFRKARIRYVKLQRVYSGF